jgi:hypothetical protein
LHRNGTDPKIPEIFIEGNHPDDIGVPANLAESPQQVDCIPHQTMETDCCDPQSKIQMRVETVDGGGEGRINLKQASHLEHPSAVICKNTAEQMTTEFIGEVASVETSEEKEKRGADKIGSVVHMNIENSDYCVATVMDQNSPAAGCQRISDGVLDSEHTQMNSEITNPEKMQKDESQTTESGNRQQSSPDELAENAEPIETLEESVGKMYEPRKKCSVEKTLYEPRKKSSGSTNLESTRKSTRVTIYESRKKSYFGNTIYEIKKKPSAGSALYETKRKSSAGNTVHDSKRKSSGGNTVNEPKRSLSSSSLYDKNNRDSTSSTVYEKERDRKKSSLGTTMLEKMQKLSASTTTLSEMLPKMRHAAKASKLTVVSVAVTSAFVLSYLPHICLIILRTASVDFDHHQAGAKRVLYNVFLRSYFLSNVANVFVYSAINTQFRAHFRRICKRCCKRESVPASDSSW